MHELIDARRDLDKGLGLSKIGVDDLIKEEQQGWKDAATEAGFDSPEALLKDDAARSKAEAEYVAVQWKSLPRNEKVAALAAPKAAQIFRKGLKGTAKREYERVVPDWLTSSAAPSSHQIHGLLASLGINGKASVQDLSEDDYDKDEDYGCSPECVKKERASGSSSKELRQFVEDSYAYTQAFYEEMGVTELTLWRGVGDQVSGKSEGADVNLQTREISSWSTDAGVATGFGQVVEIKVPIQRVLASAATFTEFEDEREALVMGSTDVTGRVDSPVNWSQR